MRGHGAVTFQTGISGFSVMGECYFGMFDTSRVDAFQELDLEAPAALWYARS